MSYDYQMMFFSEKLRYNFLSVITFHNMKNNTFQHHYKV